MSESPFQRLGPLYAKLGLETSPEIVPARIAGAKKAYSKFDELQLKCLVRGAIGLASPTELEHLTKILAVEDPTLGPESDDRELVLIAGGLLYRKIEAGGQLGTDTALAVVTSSFGGVRHSSVDSSLLIFAAERLASAQRSSNQIPVEPTYIKKPNKDAEWTKPDEFAAANNYPEAHPGLKEIVNSSFTYAEGAIEHLTTQLMTVIDHQRLLDEQMQVHWWIVGGHSSLESKPFSDLSTIEAASCAALELAELTKSRNGLAASDALLRLVIESGRTDIKSAKISDAVKAIPLERRTSLTVDLMSDEEFASLAPIHLAMALSADAGDVNDWHRRFKRITGIAATKNILPLDLAGQFYREILMLRSRS